MTSELTPRLDAGSSAVLISVPHSGTGMPLAIRERLSPAAIGLPDTDWFVGRLYDFAVEAGAGMLTARSSRYVADLNRPPDDGPLYDRATTRIETGVVPLQAFDGQPLYLPGAEPDSAEIAARLRHHWRPYHAALHSELQRIRQRHGHAVLLDAHSIRHAVPLLFEGRLPDLNLGSNGGASAAPGLVDVARRALESDRFSLVVDGRFRGGYITRHYGRPDTGVHALQLEIAQIAYMQESPPRWQNERAGRLQRALKRFVAALLQWSPDER